MEKERLYKTVWFYADLATNENHTQIFNHVDFSDYAERLEDAYNHLYQEGYEVVNVIPINMGQTDISSQQQGIYTHMDSNAYSIICDAIVVGKGKNKNINSINSLRPLQNP
ncbi:hypothetical protein [Suttonella ornithocola]|uniref:Uncharacterized protein n=1 Tax=Suttonella ornithocola TaxID=279832 RepID=A0A380MX15_9GAMM|nr:hypothetical protein [Suttonella ornithocola]SUO97125.1 Uncharacterised protein [Suttonella ornithocola]